MLWTRLFSLIVLIDTVEQATVIQPVEQLVNICEKCRMLSDFRGSVPRKRKLRMHCARLSDLCYSIQLRRVLD